MTEKKEYLVTVTGVAEQSIYVKANSDEEAVSEASELFLENHPVRLDDGSFHIEEAKIESDPVIGRWLAFKKAVRDFCREQDEMKTLAEEMLYDFEDELEVFDPLKLFHFKKLSTVETIAGRGTSVFSRYPLTDKKATIIDYNEIPTAYTGRQTEVTEGYELWLLEDMTFLVTYYHQMRVGDLEEFEIHRYREIANKNYYDKEDNMFMTEIFLDDLKEKIDFSKDTVED